VLVTAVLLYVALLRLARRIERGERELRRSEGNYRVLFDDSPAPMWVQAQDGHVIQRANRALEQLYGQPPGGMVGLALDALRLEGAPDDARQRHRRADGSTLEVALEQADLVIDGAPVRVVLVRDVSEIEAGRGALQEAVERLEDTQAIAGLGRWELDLETRLLHCPPATLRMLGEDPDEPGGAIGWDYFLELIADPDKERVRQLIQEVRQGAQRVDVHYRLRLRGGDLRWFHSRGGVVQGAGPLRLRGTLQDITEREEAQERIRRQEEQFRGLLGLLPDGVMILRGRVIGYANRACAELLGAGDERDLLGRDTDALFDVDAIPLADRFFARMRRRQQAVSRSEIFPMRRIGGEPVRVMLAARQVFFEGANAVLVVLRDLSEAEQMRDQLAELNGELEAVAKRLISVQEDERATLSRELHDDVGQSITALKLGVQALAPALPDPADQQLVGELLQGADETIHKIRNISMLLRPPQLDALGLEAALRWQVGLLFKDRRGIAVELHLAPLAQRPSGEVELAVFRIVQESLTNILRHARASRVEVRLASGVAGVVLDVRDDGAGFDPEAGGNLGLVTMRERARLAGGFLRMDTAPGEGCRIHAELPWRPAGDGPSAPAGGEAR
jgi:PAS domain S-box-containing protein